MTPRNDDLKDLARLHKEVDRMRATVERGAPAEPRRRDQAPPQEPSPAEPRRRDQAPPQEPSLADERRSQRPRTDPAAWPTYRRAEIRPKPKRRVSDAFGWTLVVIALIVLIVVIIGAAYVLHQLITAVLLATV